MQVFGSFLGGFLGILEAHKEEECSGFSLCVVFLLPVSRLKKGVGFVLRPLK